MSKGEAGAIGSEVAKATVEEPAVEELAIDPAKMFAMSVTPAWAMAAVAALIEGDDRPASLPLAPPAD